MLVSIAYRIVQQRPLLGIELLARPLSATKQMQRDAAALATLGNGVQALAAFDRALSLDPKDELALLGRGVAFVEIGEEGQAIAAYRKALEIYPKNRAAQEGLKWLLKAPAK